MGLSKIVHALRIFLSRAILLYFQGGCLVDEDTFIDIFPLMITTYAVVISFFFKI